MSDRPQRPLLPIGTQIVVRQAVVADDGNVAQRGATGRVIAVTDGRYRARFGDGREALLAREQISIRRSTQRDLALGPAQGPDVGGRLVDDHTILQTVIGSRAFGLATEDSDIDRRGVYVAPTGMWWSLNKPPQHVDVPRQELFSWEVERFVELALKANPNLLEVVNSPLIERVDALGEELLDLRPAFLSQLVFQTYSGYALGQFKKIEGDLRVRGVPRWKHVMHLLRLLLSCHALLITGEVMLDVGVHRDKLLAVRHGDMRWEDVEHWRGALHARLDEALADTVLPAVPDFARVNDWLMSVRRRSALGEL